MQRVIQFCSLLWRVRVQMEYNYDDDEKPDPSVYMDIDRQIKANKAHGRFERQSAFAGQEMKVGVQRQLWAAG